MSKKNNRNDPCPCGSNKKYKQCCLQKNQQSARYTSEGKFKFSAEVLSHQGDDQQSHYTQLFQKLADNHTHTQQQAANKYHVITKNNPSKKAIKKAKTQEERLLSQELNKHTFQVMDIHSDSAQAFTEPLKQEATFVPESFIPTQEDYLIKEKMDSDLEENPQ